MNKRKPDTFTCHFCKKQVPYSEWNLWANPPTIVFKGGGGGTLSRDDPDRWYLKELVSQVDLTDELKSYMDRGWFGFKVPHDQVKRMLLLRYLEHNKYGCHP